MCTLVCCDGPRRKVPMNYILLGAFTLCATYLTGVVSSFYETNVVLLAMVMTLGCVIGLTLFAFQVRHWIVCVCVCVCGCMAVWLCGCGCMCVWLYVWLCEFPPLSRCWWLSACLLLPRRRSTSPCTVAPSSRRSLS